MDVGSNKRNVQAVSGFWIFVFNFFIYVSVFCIMFHNTFWGINISRDDFEKVHSSIKQVNDAIKIQPVQKRRQTIFKKFLNCTFGQLSLNFIYYYTTTDFYINIFLFFSFYSPQNYFPKSALPFFIKQAELLFFMLIKSLCVAYFYCLVFFKVIVLNTLIWLVTLNILTTKNAPRVMK